MGLQASNIDANTCKKFSVYFDDRLFTYRTKKFRANCNPGPCFSRNNVAELKRLWELDNRLAKVVDEVKFVISFFVSFYVNTFSDLYYILFSNLSQYGRTALHFACISGSFITVTAVVDLLGKDISKYVNALDKVSDLDYLYRYFELHLF